MISEQRFQGGVKMGEKAFPMMACKPSAAAVEIGGEGIGRSERAEFLFFTLRFMVAVPPSMLMPAPEIGPGGPHAGNRFPAWRRQPGGHDGQSQRQVVPGKHLQQALQLPAGNGDIIGPEEDGRCLVTGLGGPVE